MKSARTKITSIIFLASLLPWGLFLPAVKVYAENDLKSVLKEVAGKIEEISELKNNPSLDGETKEKRELQARKEALEKIFNLTLLENQDLKDKLAATQNLNGDQKKIQKALLGQLAENENAYKEMRNRLETIETVKEVKQSAVDFKNWRAAVYNPKVEKIVSFTLAFQQKNALETAANRLEKIKADLKKLEDAQIIKKEDTASLLKKAGASLNEAENLNKKAGDLATEILTEELFPFKPQTNLTQTNPEEIQLTSSNQINSKTSPKEAPSVKALIEESLKQIKTTYRIFIEIGKLAREKINSK